MTPHLAWALKFQDPEVNPQISMEDKGTEYILESSALKIKRNGKLMF